MNEKIQDKLIPEIIPELQRGPQWLRDKRQESKEKYNDTPLPPRGVHLWRYTDPAQFAIDRDNVTDTAFGENYDRVMKIELKNLKQGHLYGLVTDKSGREIEFHGFENNESNGVVACSLSDACDKYPELVGKYLYSQVNSETGKFEAMNGALWNDGIFIHIPDGCVLDKPIHLLRESGVSNSAQFPRLLVLVGKNAEVTLIDEYGGGSTDFESPSYTNSSVEITGLENSHTRYVTIQRQASGAINYLAQRTYLEKDASVLTVPLAFGGAVSKQNFGVVLAGAGADSNIYGLLFGSERQHFDNHTLHHHTVGQTTSNIDFKVVLSDKANSAYTGLIRIDNDAKTCEAYQENRNLMLNKGCKAETIPELEILNEDVMCSHGATIGPIDPEMVFYLTCRGISRSEAVKMVVGGFVAKTLQQVPDDIRERVGNYVAQRLENI